jgi:hypothetical protein
MVPTPYPELNAVLQELVDSVRAALGNSFVAACLQGSLRSAISIVTVMLTSSWP